MKLWIGDRVRVLSGPYAGIEGKVVYETKNMIWIKGRKLFKVPKRGVEFYVEGKGPVHGNSLISRPWVRVVKDP